jgi:hypothetical protein
MTYRHVFQESKELKPRQTMNNAQPIFDPATHYRIEVQGRVDVDWLQSFDSSPEISVDETRQMEDITVLNVHTDQSGIVGLVRRLHGLRITILQVQIVLDRGKAAEVEEGR